MTELVEQVAALADSDPEAARQLIQAATEPLDRELAGAVLALCRNDPASACGHAERARALGAGAAAEHYLAAAYAMLGDPAQAIVSAQAAVALDASPRSRATLGSLLLAGGQPEEAAEVLRAVVEDDPDDRDAHSNLASASFQLGDYATAMSGYARAFELDPSDREPLHHLMHMFADMGKWLGAVAALEMARHDAQPAELGVALELVTIELIQQIARSYPQPNIDVRADRTVASLVARAASRAPNVQLAIARQLIEIGRVAETTKLVQALARRGLPLDAADRGNLHYLEGVLAERDRNPARALDRYTRALAADPARADACAGAISLLLAQGSAEAFGRIAELLAQIVPAARASNASLLYQEAIFLLRSDRPDDARARLEELLRVTGGRGATAALAHNALAELGPRGAN